MHRALYGPSPTPRKVEEAMLAYGKASQTFQVRRANDDELKVAAAALLAAIEADLEQRRRGGE
jgi:hypothetical protein